MFIYNIFKCIFLHVFVHIYIYLYNAVLLKISVLGALGSKEAIALFVFPLTHLFDNFENWSFHQGSSASDCPGSQECRLPLIAACLCWSLLLAQHLSYSEPACLSLQVIWIPQVVRQIWEMYLIKQIPVALFVQVRIKFKIWFSEISSVK